MCANRIANSYSLSYAVAIVTTSRIHSMRKIIISFLFLGIIVFAVIGSLYIFDVRTGEQALELFLKTEGALLLLGGCSVAISLLLAGAKKNSED